MKRIAVIIGILSIQSTLQARPQIFLGGNFGMLSANKEAKDGLTGGVQIGVQGKHIGASLSAYGYSKSNEARLLSKGTIQLMPFMLNPYVRIPISGKNGNEVAAFRLGGGAGYVSANHTLNHSVNEELNRGIPLGFGGFYYQESVDSGIGYQAGGGFDIWITRRISIGADVQYLIFRTQAKGTLIVQSPFSGTTISHATADINLDSVVAMAAVKFHF